MSPTRSPGLIRWARAALVSPMRGRSSKTSTAPSVSPSTRTSPRVGCICADASCSSVVFPAPLGPRSTHRSSARTVQSTPRNRCAWPRTTSTSRISTTGSVHTTAIQPTSRVLRSPGSRRVGEDAPVSASTSSRPVEVWPGHAAPLGAHWDGTGTNFALWSAGASAVDLCLFDAAGTEQRHRLQETTHQVWHGRLPGVGPGQRYGYRVHGPYDPPGGLRYNPARLLLDPYARAVDGELSLDPALFGYRDSPDGRTPDDRDSAPFVPRGVVIHDSFPWEGDRPPLHSWSDTVIYEVHVRGATMRHADVPPSLRGTYAGLAHPAFVEHLLGLGVTAVELLPVHHFVSEPHLLRRGLTNYWGYNTLGYFAPHAAYSSAGSAGGQVTEFKAMVKALHAAGIEVILDVVYNHTAEGDHSG